MLITVPMDVLRMLEKELTCYPQLPGVLRQCMYARQHKACGKHAIHKSQCMYVTQPACYTECTHVLCRVGVLKLGQFSNRSGRPAK